MKHSDMTMRTVNESFHASGLVLITHFPLFKTKTHCIVFLCGCIMTFSKIKQRAHIMMM